MSETPLERSEHALEEAKEAAKHVPHLDTDGESDSFAPDAYPAPDAADPDDGPAPAPGG